MGVSQKRREKGKLWIVYCHGYKDTYDRGSKILKFASQQFYYTLYYIIYKYLRKLVLCYPKFNLTHMTVKVCKDCKVCKLSMGCKKVTKKTLLKSNTS